MITDGTTCRGSRHHADRPWSIGVDLCPSVADPLSHPPRGPLIPIALEALRHRVVPQPGQPQVLPAAYRFETASHVPPPRTGSSVQRSTRDCHAMQRLCPVFPTATIAHASITITVSVPGSASGIPASGPDGSQCSRPTSAPPCERLMNAYSYSRSSGVHMAFMPT